MFTIKVTDMKSRYSKKSLLMACSFSIGAAISTISFAADISQLIGKNLDQNRDLVASVMKGRNYVVQVDTQGNIAQLIDTGANGDGSDPKQSAKSSAVPPKTAALIELPENYQGDDAIDFLGKNLAEVAQNIGVTSEKLKQMFQQDLTMRVDANNRIFFVDNMVDQHDGTLATNNAPESNATATTTGSSSVPIASAAALANAFSLHSKPGASKTIYLDFDGYSAENTAWSSSTITAQAYDLTGNPLEFDNTERSNIISIWNRIAEDYIPFDVDVTTEAPSTDALMRTNTADTTYGTRIVITKTALDCSCGGIAFMGSINLVNNTKFQPTWVFQDKLANNDKYIADAATHEIGHNLGLLHDGQKPSSTYYYGHGQGVTGWAPIMGVGYNQNVTQFNPGTYPNANNQQDDFATMAGLGIETSSDDYGNTTAAASSLTNIGTASAPNIQTFGIIGTASDIDMFVINTNGGVINLTGNPAAAGPNLDLKLALYNANGEVLATSAPEATLTANINQTVSAGTYYLAVANSEHTPSGTDAGYPTYGSLGQYQITGNYPIATDTAVPPIAKIATTALTGIAPLTVNFSGTRSVANGTITSYQWNFGDGVTATGATSSHTFTKVGTYNIQLLVTNQYQLTSTKTLQITVKAPSSALSTTMWESKVNAMVAPTSTSIQASVTLSLIDSKGKPVPNAKVEGDFTGSITGAVTGITDATGTVVLSAASSSNTGKSFTYTLKNVTAAGYVYDPTKNARTVVTLTW
jgi:PKD repeat protein